MRLLFGMLVSACAILPAAAPAQDVLDVAAGNPEFSTMMAAVQAAGMVERLKAEGPFTIFAPTNRAFANLPPGTLDDLLKPENKGKLTTILTYHIVPGVLKAADVVKLDGQGATTVEGGPLPIRFNGESIRVGDAAIVRADIEASNGVIHAIDMVLLPPSPERAAALTPVPPAATAAVYDAGPIHHPAVPAAAHAAFVAETVGAAMPAPTYGPYDVRPVPVRAYPAYRPMWPYGHHHAGSSCGR